MNAVGNINPRPYSEDLDRYSIPSKTIEYFSSGKPTISVKNSKLQRDFGQDAIWAKSSNVDDLAGAIERLFELTEEERNELGKKARTKVLAKYSLDNVGEKLTKFLEGFLG